jgi:hypothetical protein
MKCADCPDLMGDRMPPDWVPRPRCCADEHIDRRVAGSFDPWVDHATARAASAEDDALKSRQVRRAEERARQKAGR